MKAKIKVNFEDFYKGFMETARRKDLKLEELIIEGELIKPFAFKVGDFVTISKFSDVFGNEGRTGRIIQRDDKGINSGCYHVCFSRSKNSTHGIPYQEDYLDKAIVSENDFYGDFGIYSEIDKKRYEERFNEQNK